MVHQGAWSTVVHHGAWSTVVHMVHGVPWCTVVHGVPWCTWRMVYRGAHGAVRAGAPSSSQMSQVPRSTCNSHLSQQWYLRLGGGMAAAPVCCCEAPPGKCFILCSIAELCITSQPR